MKKQLIAIGLASVLTAPSVALADVTIYGSFRTGLAFTSGTGASDATVASFYSRFGLKGSSEVSEGLTASFQAEDDYNSATGTTPGTGRVGKVALSGGFGTLALGHLWTASGNYYYGKVASTLQHGVTGGATSHRSNMVSYSSSVGAVSFQIDRYTDDNAAEVVEFGASTTAGPVEVGFAYWGKEAAATTVIPTTVVSHNIYKADSTDATKVDSSKEVLGTRVVETNKNGTVTSTTSVPGTVDDPKDKTKKLDKHSAAKLAKGVEDGTGQVSSRDIRLANPKTSFNGIYVSSSLAGMKLTVGLGSVDHGVKNVKQVADKTTKVTPKDVVDESQTDVSVINLTGSIGDSGVSYALQMSDSDKVWEVSDLGETSTTTSIDPSETVITLTSALGGGASLVFEHSATKALDSSLVALKVDF